MLVKYVTDKAKGISHFERCVEETRASARALELALEVLVRSLGDRSVGGLWWAAEIDSDERLWRRRSCREGFALAVLRAALARKKDPISIGDEKRFLFVAHAGCMARRDSHLMGEVRHLVTHLARTGRVSELQQAIEGLRAPRWVKAMLGAWPFLNNPDECGVREKAAAIAAFEAMGA